MSTTEKRQPKPGEIESFVIQAMIACRHLEKIMEHKANATVIGRPLEEADGKRSIAAVWLEDGQKATKLLDLQEKAGEDS